MSLTRLDGDVLFLFVPMKFSGVAKTPRKFELKTLNRNKYPDTYALFLTYAHRPRIKSSSVFTGLKKRF